MSHFSLSMCRIVNRMSLTIKNVCAFHLIQQWNKFCFSSWRYVILSSYFLHSFSLSLSLLPILLRMYFCCNGRARVLLFFSTFRSLLTLLFILFHPNSPLFFLRHVDAVTFFSLSFSNRIFFLSTTSEEKSTVFLFLWSNASCCDW